MEFREIAAADVPALFYVRTRTRENTYTLEDLRRLGITIASVIERLANSCKGWLCTHADQVVAFCIADRPPASSGSSPYFPSTNVEASVTR